MTSRPGVLRFFFTYWLPVLLYITLIIGLSSRPNLASPFHFFNGDKLAHVMEYFVLGWLMVRALRHSFFSRSVLAAVLLAITLGVMVGAGDEWFQSFIPGRDSSARDLLADFLGIALAQITYLMFTREV
jgi:hypothetical protein